MTHDPALLDEVTGAIQVRRERGYLGRGPGRNMSAREHVFAWAVFLVGVAFLGLAAAILGTLPAEVAAWGLVWMLLLPATLAVAAGVAWMAMGASEWLHRRGRPVVHVVAGSAAAAAVGVTAGWIALIIDPPSPGPERIVGAGVALLLGEIFVVSGLARWITARLLRKRLDAVVSGPRLRTVLTLTLALTLGGVITVFAVRARPADTVPAAPIRVRPSDRKLAILGVDGASRREILLLGQGSPSGLQPGRWSWARLSGLPEDAELPVRWITLGTGLGHDRHGVTTLHQVQVSGCGRMLLLSPGLRRVLVGMWGWTGLAQERTVPAASRRAPTVWEMASRGGIPVRVFGWWGSFPPRRVRGLVASERWLLMGERSPDTLFPMRAASTLPAGAGSTPLDIDRRAATAVTKTDARWNGLIMAYFPGWWLAEERRPAGALLLRAAEVRPHLEILGQVVSALRRDGFPVCLIGLTPGRPGWVMWSSPSGRQVPALRPADLVQTWLDALALPPAAGLGGFARRDLSGISGPRLGPAMSYGPPPPLVAHASQSEGAAQLELLRSLGYLQ